MTYLDNDEHDIARNKVHGKGSVIGAAVGFVILIVVLLLAGVPLPF